MAKNQTSYSGRLPDHHTYRIFAICLLFSFVVQFFVDYDSPLHYGFKHIDGAWFLMCGKAMMNGLVPYVDFTDSKDHCFGCSTA